VSGLVYQVFPDRFAIGGARDPAAPPWEARPRPTDREFFGGDLDGIAAHLGHLAELGAATLYLTPIHDAPSSHRYDPRDYKKTDERLGGDAAFARLAAATRERGLGLVLDGVFNHSGAEHPWFLEAKRDATSASRRFYTFGEDGKHLAWRGHGHLPELRLEEPALLEELVLGEASVVKDWLRRGATGWRLDCANDMGVPVCAAIRREAHREGAPDGVIGELCSWAGSWLADGALDGVMNYYFRETVIGLLTGDVPGEQAQTNLAFMASQYPHEALLRSWNIVGSHDTPRVRTLLRDRERVLLAFLLGFTYPGKPFVYQGDEIGMEGGEDPDNRRAMIWDRTRWDETTIAHLKLLGQIRDRLPALREGRYLPLVPSSRDAVAFARTTEDPRETVLVVANPTEERLALKVFAPRSELFGALPLEDWLGGKGMIMHSGSFQVALGPFEGAILVPRPVEATGYDFMKRAPRGHSRPG
jgi:glycosidase